MVTPNPIFSGKVDVSQCSSTNHREIIESHVEYLVESMTLELKDMSNPVTLYVTKDLLDQARQALKEHKPFLRLG
jgi:hypothetical protein